MPETDQIEITLNGESRQVPANCTVQKLVEGLKLPSGQVAVEVNRSIARRSSWPQTCIQDGDSIEIVHFVGGG